LSDNGLYARDPALFNKLSAELVEIRAQKDSDEERWLTLEMEREALEEATNDLDLETLDLLEEVIADYPGTALIVSHDRDFLDRVATGIVFAQGDGRFTEYAGGYSDMLAQRSGKTGKALETRKAAAKAPVEKRARTNAPKMNFADAHALKILPEKIAEAEIKMAELEQRLSDSGLYARDAALFAKLSEELAKIRAQKDSDEERWLTLEMEREALEEAGEGEQPS